MIEDVDGVEDFYSIIDCYIYDNNEYMNKFEFYGLITSFADSCSNSWFDYMCRERIDLL